MSDTTTVLRPTRATVLGGLLGGAATSAGIALTATSGWLVVRASERPVILTLLAAIVAVRAFGMARPFFRYLERIVSHDAALADLADRRGAVYRALVPLTPARLGRRSRSAVLTGVVDDLTDVVEAQVRVTVPLVSSAVAGLLATALTAAFAPAVGLVVAGLLVVVALGCVLAWWFESRSRDELLAARAETARVGDLVARQAGELRAIGAEDAALGWLDAAHATLRAAVRRQSRGRALVAALLLLGTAAATVAAATVVDPAATGGPVAALLVLVPVAVGEALAPLVDTMRALARAQGSRARLERLLDQDPAVHEPAHPATRPDSSAAGGGGVRLESASASWTGVREDLAPTDLELVPGRHVAVVGPTGRARAPCWPCSPAASTSAAAGTPSAAPTSVGWPSPTPAATSRSSTTSPTSSRRPSPRTSAWPGPAATTPPCAAPRPRGPAGLARRPAGRPGHPARHRRPRALRRRAHPPGRRPRGARGPPGRAPRRTRRAPRPPDGHGRAR